MIKNDEQLEEILTKMCEAVGIKYEDVDFTKEGYYLDYEWDYEQEQEFIEWLEKYLRKSCKTPKSMVGSSASLFTLNYGWKTKR